MRCSGWRSYAVVDCRTAEKNLSTVGEVRPLRRAADAYDDRSGRGHQRKHLDARSGEKFESSLDQGNASACFDGGNNARRAVRLLGGAGSDLAAEARLRNMKPGGRPGDILLLGNGHEIAQMADFHWAALVDAFRDRRTGDILSEAWK
jgi:hypothetical protein